MWRESQMSKRNLGMAIILCVALAMIVAAQAPQGGPPAAGAGQGGAGGGRGGAGAGGGGGRGGGGGGAPAAPAGPIVRGPDGKPDMTGYWMATTTTNINQGRGVILD